MISSIKIKGFRGFAEEQELKLSKPNGDRGSGLTVIVGPNNGGKSTVIESFKVMASQSNISFAEGQRNKKAGDRVEIVLSSYDKCPTYNLKTISAGGSEAKRDQAPPLITVLPSRRFFNPYSNKASYSGDQFLARAESIMLKPRGQPIDAEDNRLFKVVENPKMNIEFNKLLKKVLGYELKWSIDLCNTGNYYVKINWGDGYHDSDGLGEGLVSLLFLVESLFEPSKDKLVVIDEPELSLHPQLQRNLLEVILDYSKEFQILYATHSPEMVSIKAILNGGNLCRIVNRDKGSKIYQLNNDSRSSLEKFEGNIYNPHTLGYDARSCFFADDGLVVVEGQEDVGFLKKALDDLNIKKKIRFFGFGAGGAENIRYILKILNSLGFEKICCLYDGDKKNELDKTKKLFSQYDFELLNADDIRDKECKCNNIRDEENCINCRYRKKEGIFDKKHNIKPELKEEFESLITKIADKYGY